MLPQHADEDGVGLGASTDPRVLQPLWDAVLGRRDVLLASPLAPGVGALLVHLALCAPFLLLDVLAARAWPRVRAYRISEEGAAAAAGTRAVLRQWGETLARIVRRYATVVVPFTAALRCLLATPRFPRLAPTCWQLCAHVALGVLLFDLLFYAWHRAMHR